MLVSTHILLSFIAAIFMYPHVGWYSLIFFLAGVLIDIDHVIEYAIRKKDFNPLNAYKSQIKEFYKDRNKLLGGENLSWKQRAYIFHFLEVVFLIGLIGLFSKVAFYIFLGFMFHILLDFVFGIYIKIKYRELNPKTKMFSLVKYWFLHNK